MPGYRTHITVSSIAGGIIALGVYHLPEFSLANSLLAGSLCTIGGMVPDIDSKTSQSFRNCMAIVAGFASLMLVSRLSDFVLDAESVALIGGGCFLLFWFLVGWLIHKLTVHRGMCHSIPTVIITSEIIYILSSGNLAEHFLNAAAIGIGMLLHLILDEMFSVTVGKNGKIRIKKSLGSALKLINFDDMKGTLVTFIILILTTNAAVYESSLTKQIENRTQEQRVDNFIENYRSKVIQELRTDYPQDFDRAALSWAQENDLIIQPRTTNNAKWNELRQMVRSSQN